MYDLDHWFSGDTTIADSGDLNVITNVTLTQQRILRRILTNKGDYIWNPDYGCGAAQYVGATSSSLNELRAIILTQLAEEEGVSNSSTPDVTFRSEKELLYITIRYVDTSTGQQQTLAFDTGGAL